MRRTLRHGLLVLVAVATAVGCSGGGKGESEKPAALRFSALPQPPKPFDTAGRLADNDDTILALIDGRLFRYDPWTTGAIWLELGRDLPSARSRLVSWNDRVWYLTNDHGRLELATVALSGEQRADTRAVSGATDASLAILAARNAIFVFGAEGGFRIDRDGVYSEFPGAPNRQAVPDWSTARLAELDDGTVVVTDADHLSWIFEPDLARWREPPTDLEPSDVRSITVSTDGVYIVAGTPPKGQRLVASNRLEAVNAALDSNCNTSALYPSDLGIVTVGCGRATLADGTEVHRIDVPAGTSIVHGPRGRPLAIRSDSGALSLLQFTP
jgi:hypothetical protein